MRKRTTKRLTRTMTILAIVVAFFAAAETASAQLITRNASRIAVKVDGNGRFMLKYVQGGRWRETVVWGAINARFPTAYPTPQVKFRVDYSGGWGTWGYKLWGRTVNRCRAYDGPPLPFLTRACKAPDGSYWAVQQYQRLLPAYGIRPWKAYQSARELHVSHWSGPLPRLEVGVDWLTSRMYGTLEVHEIFGRFTYKGVPVYGFNATSAGAPLDSYGRLAFLSTYNSRYGSGWKRENAFLFRNPGGNFCYGFYKHARPSWYPTYYNWPRPQGNGAFYRLYAQGPGVTPFVGWSGRGLPDYDPNNPEHVQHEAEMNALRESFRRDPNGCYLE